MVHVCSCSTGAILGMVPVTHCCYGEGTRTANALIITPCFSFSTALCVSPPHVIVRNKSASRSQPSAAAVAVNSNSSSSLCFFPFLFHTELQRCFIDPTIHGPLETNCEVEKGRSAGLAGWVWWWDERQPLVDAPGHFLQGLRLPRSN